MIGKGKYIWNCWRASFSSYSRRIPSCISYPLVKYTYSIHTYIHNIMYAFCF